MERGWSWGLTPSGAAVLLALALSGCASAPTAAQFAAPTLILLDGDDLPEEDTSSYDEIWNPERICMRVVNNADRSWSTGLGSFYVVDGNRTLHQSDLTATYWIANDFPSFVEFPPNTALEGCIKFDIDAAAPAPYTLNYRYPAGTVSLVLPLKP